MSVEDHDRKAFEAMTHTTDHGNSDTLIETWEVGELEARLEHDAMVSCTPYWDAKPVLPTLEVPYADRMVWEWEIAARRVRINKVVVVAKTTHRFTLNATPHQGDTLIFYLMAQDLSHGH